MAPPSDESQGLTNHQGVKASRFPGFTNAAAFAVTIFINAIGGSGTLTGDSIGSVSDGQIHAHARTHNQSPG